MSTLGLSEVKVAAPKVELFTDAGRKLDVRGRLKFHFHGGSEGVF